ncbi:hypothetical protein CPB85DRAFT_1455075 [Mucidula mucida]|nr:hypothetical protein CPB85DRAFT_1455075 [Mucidula mucida]
MPQSLELASSCCSTSASSLFEHQASNSSDCHTNSSPPISDGKQPFFAERICYIPHRISRSRPKQAPALPAEEEGLRYPKNQWRYAARLFSVPVQQFLSLGQGVPSPCLSQLNFAPVVAYHLNKPFPYRSDANEEEETSSKPYEQAYTQPALPSSGHNLCIRCMPVHEVQDSLLPFILGYHLGLANYIFSVVVDISGSDGVPLKPQEATIERLPRLYYDRYVLATAYRMTHRRQHLGMMALTNEIVLRLDGIAKP